MDRKVIRNAVILLILNQLVHTASAGTDLAELWDLFSGLKTLASSLGLVIITYDGIAWIIGEGAQDREEAKKGIIYAMAGMIFVSSAQDITRTLYCDNIKVGGC